MQERVVQFWAAYGVVTFAAMVVDAAIRALARARRPAPLSRIDAAAQEPAAVK